MSEQSEHNNQHPDPELDKIFQHIPRDEREHAVKVWELSGKLKGDHPEVTGNEVEQALRDVKARIESDRGGAVHTSSGSDFWRWIAAAAVILLVFGTSYLLIPKKATAPYGEIVNIELPDGSTAELNSGTTLQYNRLFAYTNRSLQLNGEAYFSVVEDDHPFTVNAGYATIEVTGTAFNVRSWQDEPGRETEVAVSEGSVWFFAASRRDGAVKIEPGEVSRVTDRMINPTVPEAVALENIIGWRDKMLIFNKKSISAIIRELERRFDVNIRLENEEIGHEVLTAYYGKPEDVETVLQDICRVKGLNYSESANGYRIYQK